MNILTYNTPTVAFSSTSYYFDNNNPPGFNQATSAGAIEASTNSILSCFLSFNKAISAYGGRTSTSYYIKDILFEQNILTTSGDKLTTIAQSLTNIQLLDLNPFIVNYGVKFSRGVRNYPGEPLRYDSFNTKYLTDIENNEPIQYISLSSIKIPTFYRFDVFPTPITLENLDTTCAIYLSSSVVAVEINLPDNQKIKIWDAHGGRKYPLLLIVETLSEALSTNQLSILPGEWLYIKNKATNSIYTVYFQNSGSSAWTRWPTSESGATRLLTIEPCAVAGSPPIGISTTGTTQITTGGSNMHSIPPHTPIVSKLNKIELRAKSGDILTTIRTITDTQTRHIAEVFPILESQDTSDVYVGVEPNTGTITLSSPKAGAFSFFITATAVDPTDSTGRPISLSATVPVIFKEPSINDPAYPVKYSDIVRAGITFSNNESLNDYISFDFSKPLFVKDSYTQFDKVLARYAPISKDGSLPILSSAKNLSLVLIKDFNSVYSWKLINGDPYNDHTVLYKLSTNPSGSVNSLFSLWNRPNQIWVPALSSYPNINSNVFMAMTVSNPAFKPVINNPDVIFIDERNSLVTFRIDASFMEEDHLLGTNNYKVEEIINPGVSRISQQVFVEPETGLVFTGKLRAGGTYLKIYATNKHGTASKIVKVVVGTHNQTNSNFGLISSSTYSVSGLFSPPEIDHVVVANITQRYGSNLQYTSRAKLKFANKKPDSDDTNYYKDTYLPIERVDGYRLHHDSDYDLPNLNEIYIEVPGNTLLPYWWVGGDRSSTNRNYPFIRKFKNPIAFGPNKQPMYWGIVAEKTSPASRTRVNWDDDVPIWDHPEPYIFVNPINSNSIPLTGWLQSAQAHPVGHFDPYNSSEPLTYYYNMFGNEDSDSVELPAFYTSRVYQSLFGALSTASPLVSASNLTMGSEYYAYASNLLVNLPSIGEEQEENFGTTVPDTGVVKNARIKINADVDLIQNRDSFAYTNSDLIYTRYKEFEANISDFWSTFTSNVEGVFTLPAPPNLFYKYTNNKVPYPYKPHELLEYKSNFLNSLSDTGLALNYALLLDNKAWITLTPPIGDSLVTFINAGKKLPTANSIQTSVYNSYASLPAGKNRLKGLYWLDSDSYPRIVGNKNGIGYFGSLSAKCYWGIQDSVSSFYAVNPNYNNSSNISSFEFPMTGWLTTQNKGSFRVSSTYARLSSAPLLSVNVSLKPKLYYSSIQNIPNITSDGTGVGILVNHGSALVFRGNVTSGDFNSSQKYLEKGVRLNRNYIATDPMVAYGTDTKLGAEHVAALRASGYL